MAQRGRKRPAARNSRLSSIPSRWTRLAMVAYCYGQNTTVAISIIVSRAKGRGLMPFTQNFYGSIGTNANIEYLNGILTINGNQVLTANSDAKNLAQEQTSPEGTPSRTISTRRPVP
jgi:hypothetical protein